ncbi:MAG: chloride channel protein [Chloroflexota bacterium]|nr:chloride channel protein [Chloroflexota bacterium]
MNRWTGYSWGNWLIRIASYLRRSENALFLALASLLGMATGLCVWFFREAIAVFHTLFTGFQDIVSPVIGSLAIIISLALAGALVGWIMERFIGEERHHGVAGIMEAVALTGGRLRYGRMPYKALASALSLGAGASIGPEDPSVQIGANLGSWFAHILHIPEDQSRLLVAAGAASAISAAFGAPIAGVFFALEVILNGAFETRSFGVIVLASVVSSAVTQAIQPMSEMGPFNYALGSPLEIPLFIPLGIILAIVSVIFVRTVYWQHELWNHLARLPRPARTALAGSLVGVVGIFLPQIMGVGRETMSAVLSGEVQFTLAMLLALAGFKILMTSVSMAGGFVGGIFAPALFVGTMVGSLYGQLIGLISRDPRLGDPKVYAIVGMAATMGGVVRSPITAIMLVFEMTNDYRLILPMMLTTVVCVYLSERLEPHGIYMHSLFRQGIHLPQGLETDLMQGVTVEEAMLKPAPIISETASLAEMRDTLRYYRSNSLCVVDQEGLLYGVVTLSDLQRAYARTQDQSLTVGEICSREVVTVFPHQQVWEAIRAMSVHDIGRVPVVRRGTREVVGLIGRHGVVRAYNVASAHKLRDQHIAEQIRLNMLTGGHIAEYVVELNSAVFERKICEVVWPSESAVVAIRRHGRLIVPHGNTDIQAGDVVIIISDDTASNQFDDLFTARQ